MKSVMISIKPKWCELIASGKKTVEVRRTKPNIDIPFKCYIYETKARSDMPTFVDEDGHVLYIGRGQVIGEFVCDRIDAIDVIDDGIMTYIRVDQKADPFIKQKTCLGIYELQRYLCYPGGSKTGFGWHISDLKVYDEPKELKEFRKPDKEVNGVSEQSGHIVFWDGHTPGEALKRAPQSWMFVEDLL